jgi:hypothetical protein
MGKITIVNRQTVWTWSIFHAIFHVAIWNWSNSMVPSSTWWNSNQLRSGLNLWKMDTPPVLPIPQKMRNLSIMAILAHPEINLSTGCPQSIAFSWFISGWIQWFMVDITIYRLFHCYIYISWYMVDIILYSIHGAYFMVYKPTFTSPGVRSVGDVSCFFCRSINFLASRPRNSQWFFCPKNLSQLVMEAYNVGPPSYKMVYKPQ